MIHNDSNNRRVVRARQAERAALWKEFKRKDWMHLTTDQMLNKRQRGV